VILNDPQSKPFLDPAEPVTYTAPLTVAYPAIKIADQSAKVIGGVGWGRRCDATRHESRRECTDT
jgi:hypothetical protein